MVLVYDLAQHYLRPRVISNVIAVLGGCMYLVCFWLTIGYCFLGYGTRQYQALNIPPYCQSLGVSWQTDPRRKNFVRMQVVIFLSASVGFIVAVVYYRTRERAKKREKQREAARSAEANAPVPAETAPPDNPVEVNAPKGFFHRQLKKFGEWKTRVSAKVPKYPAGQRFEVTMPKVGRFGGGTIPFTMPTFRLSEQLTKIVLAFVLFPVVAGFIMAVILNDHAYLLLGQKGCYASYVSSRWGYLDLELLTFKVKLATWLGLNT